MYACGCFIAHGQETSFREDNTHTIQIPKPQAFTTRGLRGYYIKKFNSRSQLHSAANIWRLLIRGFLQNLKITPTDIPRNVTHVPTQPQK